MTKKLLSAIITMALLFMFAAIPSANAATFSSANWVQYERGFYTSTSNFTENMQVYTTDSDGDSELTSVRMVASTSSKITSTKNPVAYKFGQSASDYAERASDSATYAHMVLYVATFDDANHNLFDDYYIRMDKDGTGSSRDAFVVDSWKNDSEIYAVSYTNSAAYDTRDWTGILKKQGYNGNGPNASTAAADCDARTRTLADSDYDKIDIIVEYNKQAGATTYIFANGKFMANWYDSGLTDKHFHGIVFRTPANKTPRNNSSYIAVKMDTSRIGHREYYNTNDYYVTFEDVLNDAGLGDAIDSTMMFKTSEIQNYMPGNNQAPYTFIKDASARSRINEKVTYSGNTATVTVTNTDTENYEVAANMLAGMYPLIGKMGVAYEDYHPRASFIKLSFDQTISNDGMWLEYASYYSGKVRAIQMWNNGGNLVVGTAGGSNVTCNGSGSKPTATTLGTNHIDWILEPVDGTNVKQYVFVNDKLAGEGFFGNEYAPRINDIILSTKNASGTVTIDNWSMTVYNENATLEGIEERITGNAQDGIHWTSDNKELGYKINGGEEIAVFINPGNINGLSPSANTKVIAAIYDDEDCLMGVELNRYSEEISNTFDYEVGMDIIKAFFWEDNGDAFIPLIDAKTIQIESFESVSADAMRVKNGSNAIITIIHDDGALTTAEYLNREFEKNNLNGTVGIIGKNINTSAKVQNWTNVLNASNGRLNLASHSYNHRYMGESDEAESGTLQDGTNYNYPAGHMTEDIANERARINSYFPDERVLTFIKPGTSYPEGKAQVSDAAMAMIREHYIAMRNTGGNVDTIPPADYYSVKSLMAKPDQDTQYWINLLSSAVNKNGILVYLFHEIIDSDTASGNNVRQSDASAFFKELSRYVSDGRVWNAKFDEAIQYMREYEAITDVTAVNHFDSKTISVSVTDSVSRMENDILTGKYAGREIYDYPITVKVKLPYNWEYVKVWQAYDNRVEIVKPFTENGARYVYANVVPDVNAAILSEAAASDYVSAVSYGGTAIQNFDPATKYYKVTLPAGTATAPALSCDQSSAAVTQATLWGGEGSGFITYGGVRYEVHFSVSA